MPELLPKERLQPALLDRLTDEVRSIERELARDRAELLPRLDAAEKAALARLLDPERRTLRPPGAAELQPFARLDAATLALLERVVAREQQRQFELRQHHVISAERLRALVLRDLTWLFNTERLAWRPLAGEGTAAAAALALDGFPEVARSVVNYGIPSLSGKVGAGMSVELLEREVRDAIRAFEPRLRADTVRVKAVLDPERMSRNTLAFEIEAELWAEPLPLRLWLRTLIDLEDGTARVEEKPA
jgi:type VI secretion system protein ImpF